MLIMMLVVLVLLGFDVTGFAEERKEVELKEIVVTATKTEAEIEDVPASVVVITKDEIKAKGAEKIKDIIRFDSSFNIIRSMGRDVPSIRGFKPEHTLILIDGKRITGEVGLHFELDRITLENVERIEIIRGPQSALYGTDALGGVINIITTSPKRFTFEVRPEYGTYSGGGSQRNINSYIGGQIGKLGLSLSGTLLDIKPYLREGISFLPEEKRTNVSFKTDYNFTRFTRLTFDAGYMNEDVEVRSLARGAIHLDLHDNKRYDLSLALSHKSPDLDYLLRGYLSSYEKDFEYRKLSDNKLGRFDMAKRRTPVVEGKITKEIFKNHLATIGGEYRHEFFKGTRLKTGKNPFIEEREGVKLDGSEAEINYWAGYIQDEWLIFDKFLIIPAVRYDDSDKFRSKVSPKIGITYKPLPELRLKVNYGQGFKTPTPRELYIEFGHPGPRYMIVGNPNVNPEISYSYDASLEGEMGFLSGKVTYFYNDIKDLIEAVEVPPSEVTPSPIRGWRYYQFRNINKAKTQGVEAEVGFSITKELSLKGSYTYLDAKDETNNTRLTQRPRHKAITKLAYDNKRIGLRGNIWGEYIGDNLLSLTPENKKDYSLWYVSIAKDIWKYIEIYAGADNLFDKKDDDIPIVGAFYYGGVKAKF